MERSMGNIDLSDKRAIAAAQNIKERDYWRAKMAGEPVKYHFYYDYKKTGDTPKKMDVVQFRWADELFTRLMRLSNEYDYTLYMILAAGLTLLLHKYNYGSTGDIIMGAPIYKQETTGDFINTVLPLRNRLEPGMTFKELLLRVKDTVVEANKHQNYPMEALLEYLGMSSAEDDFPLFDIAILLENIQKKEYFGKLSLDMIFSMQRTAKSIEGMVKYNASLYRRSSVETIVAHYTRVLEVVLGSIDIRISFVDMLSEQEKKRLLFDFNQAEPGYPKDKTIPQLFEEQVERMPEQIAIVGHGQTRTNTDNNMLTYRQLNEQSGELAGLLIEKGVLADNIVGIMMERSIDLIIGILGILKAGGAYLPINPENPQERVNYMLRDSAARILIKKSEAKSTKSRVQTNPNDQNSNDQNKKFEELMVLNFEHLNFEFVSSFDIRISDFNSSNLAYVIYTSGSTGMPKGVPITHANLSPLLHWGYKHLGIGSKDRTLQNLSYYFDWSVWEIFITLTRGAALYIIADEFQLDPAVKADYIDKNKITILHITPTQYSYLVNLGRKLETLKYLFIGAEKLTVELLKRSFESVGEDCRVFNMYGPTEATIISAVLEAKRGEENEYVDLTSVPIGGPVGNGNLLVLNKDNNLCPVNIPGELYIGGDGVAGGYLNNPELTAEKFIKYRSYRTYRTYINYKTGDLARWIDDGNIEFLGRIDQQVKIRGFRIELGEIENCLLTHPEIKEAVVIAKKDRTGGQEEYNLCSYVVAVRELKTSELREYLSAKLPDYMIPAYFVRLARMPLTPNGKLDRKALPEPGTKIGEGYIAPRDAIEEKLAEIWSGILGIDKDLISMDTSFFELGGHSLKANVLISKIHKELNTRVPLTEIFLKPTILELAEHLKGAAESVFVFIEPVEKKEYYKLSSAQKRLFILQQIDPASTAYNLPVVLKLAGEVHKKKLENTFQRLIERHESLRTSFETVSDEPVQRIHENAELEIEMLGIRDQGAGGIEEKRINFIRPFDLSRAPLLRVALIRIEENSFELMMDMHHIITDRISQLILRDEFNNLYYHEGEGLPELKLQYRDYSEWQNNENRASLLRKQESYWLKEFGDEFPALTLPTDYVRPAVWSFAGTTVKFLLSGEENLTLKALAKVTNTTLFMVILAVFNVLLSKLSGQEDVIVGTALVGRPHADLERIIGMFVNTLPLRNLPIGEKSFKAFLSELKNRTLEAFENQDYPFEELVDKVSGKKDRDPGRNPIFDAVFSLINREEYTGDIGTKEELYAVNSHDFKHKEGTAKFDITLTAIDLDESMILIFEYCTRLFKPSTIDRFIAYFRRILHLLAAAPDTMLFELEIISEEEKRRILFDFSNTEKDYPKDNTIHRLFEEQVEKSPDSLVLVGADVETLRATSLQITYCQLDEQSDWLAGLLIEKGLLPDAIVGIMMERSIDLIIGILGILKAGGAYLPINPGNPPERIDYMLKDSGAKLLVTSNDKEGKKVRRWEGEKIFSEEISKSSYPLTLLPSYLLNPSNLAYVIYTSGSTGMPKGVAITHANLSPLLHWGYKNLGIGSKDRVLQNLSYYFDWSVWEIFITLTRGAALYIVADEFQLDPAVKADYIDKNKITVLHITPTQYSYLVNLDRKLETLKYLFVGAEKLTNDLLKRSFESVGEDCRVFNMYGPTEATIISAVLEAKRGEENEYVDLTSVPIGGPVGNGNLLVLNKDNNLCPVNIPGELYIGGDGVAGGYLNNPELTAEKFIKHRSYRTNRTYINYKTGDLARWLDDGNIEFLGRIDQQVKIRGFRIELGEIENCLLTHPEIKEAVVIAKEDSIGGQKEYNLCAYVVSTRELKASEWREYLSTRLPDYMIPAYFEQLTKMPLTPNGKLDRKTLPEPVKKTGEGFIGPRDTLEKKLTEIWSGILGIDKDLISMDASFFELGGHSLKANVLATKIQKELNAKIPLTAIFLKPRLMDIAEHIRDSEKYKELGDEIPLKEIYPMPRVFELAGQLKGTARSEFVFIESAEKKEYYALSSAQERLYVLQHMDLGSTAYNLPVILKLEGEVHEEKLENSFRGLIKRHESLRTSFETIDDEPVQRVHDNVEFEIEYKSSSDYTDYRDEKVSSGTLLWSPFIRSFDLSRAPLLRVVLVKLKENRYELIIDMHHIITDGVSMGVLVKEFISLYKGESLPLLRLQYKDYSEWQNRDMVEKKGEFIKQQEIFWLEEFGCETPVLDLPVDYPKPKVQGFEGRGERFIVDAKDTQALRLFARELGATLYMVLLSIYNIFLARITHQETIVVGTPTAGRVHIDLEGIIGMFVNTLALKNEPAGDKTIGEFLIAVREKTLQAFANQEYQYEELVKRTAASRDMGRNPLFDTMFVYQDLDISTVEIPGLKATPYEYERDTSKFDLTLECRESENRLDCTLEYSTKLFKRETIYRFIGYHRNIISTLLENPRKRIAEIDMLPEEEKRRLVMEFNDTAEKCPNNKTIYHFFEEQMEKIPDHAALVFKDKVLTYRHFDEGANRVANYLRNEKGIREGDRVAVLMERSMELIYSLMGIMKSGGAYVPLDATLPTERLRVVFNDASIGIAISVQKYLEKLTGLQSQCKVFHSILCMDSPNAAAAIDNYPVAKPGIGHAANPAYVMYTSGSSGIPKGVLVEHRTIVNTLWWRKNFYGYNPDSVSLQNPPYFFDSSVTDIFTPLLGGARLVLIEESERLDLAALKKIITNHKVTHFIAVPAFYNVLLEEIGDELSCLKMVCAAGEYFPDELVKKHFKKLPRVRITNEYGPTENSVNTTIYELTLDSPRAYIGKPIWNVSVYILDRYTQLCPMGVSGEICLSGSSLARGYLNRPELTNEKFDRNFRRSRNLFFKRFLAAGGILYRTGDMGRWLPDGNLEFIGRLDSQVKIRGIRIETGEIENHLLRHHNIKQAVVLAREGAGGEKFLCAYIVPSLDSNKKPGLGDGLKEYLSLKLPDYMIPSYFIVIDAIPLMANGKINRDALPLPSRVGFLQEGLQSSIAPRNESEEKLAVIWSEVLGIEKERIGIDEDFFELGGHSLRATIVASRIHKMFNVKIPLAEIFIFPTIRGLAKYISGTGEQMYAAIEPAEKKEYYPLSAAQKRLYLLYRMEPDNVSYNMPQEIRFQEEINIERLQRVFKQLIDRHESLRTSFEMVGEAPVQRVHDHVEFEIEISKVFDPTFFQKGGFIRPFDLSRAPLLRVVIIKEENGKHLVWVDIHHIITDGTSQAILRAEFDKLYRGEGVDLPALKLQYKDYSQWQNSELQQSLVKKQESYWLKELGEELPVLNLPIDYARPFIQSFEGNTVEFILTGEESQTFKRMARDANATLFMVILAVFNVLLSKLSGQEDIIVGTPVMGRRHADLECILGMFINTLPLRNTPHGEMKLTAYLNELKARTLEAYENQEYPFEELVERVSVKRDAGRNPIFDVVFNLLNQEDYTGDICIETGAHEYIHKRGTSKFDLTLTAVDLGERLLLAFEYCSRLFEPDTIERFIGYLKRLLYWLQAMSDPLISGLEIITEEEKQEILYEFNDNYAGYPMDKTIHQLFTEQVGKTPDYIAVIAVHELHEMTYRELAEKSGRLAQYLVQKGKGGIRPIGLMADYSIEMFVGMLGILKAGCAYVPLNPKAPFSRTEYMLNECSANVLLTTYPLFENSENMGSWEGEKVFLEEICQSLKSSSYPLNFLPSSLQSSANLAYIIFTSGSTGQPKGVPISHANFCPFLHWGYQYLEIGTKDRTVRNLAYYFDWSVWEIFITLTTGAGLYIVPDEMLLNPGKCIPFMMENEITILHVTPSQYQNFINAGRKLDTLKYLFIGAEKLTVSLLKKSLETVATDCRVFNMYGPTEATIVSAVYEVNRGDDNEYANLSSIPIGAPMANGVLLVLDRYMNLCLVNITGELYIGGDGVAGGYLNNPELASEKFIKNRSFRLYKASIFYKTGDLCRWLPDGNIEFLGRVDQQVKIRGFRIELGEIEKHLKMFPGINEAVVIDRMDGDRQFLCAYFTIKEPGQTAPPAPLLRAHLEGKLPVYMIPACFLEIDRIPLNPNGKIDLNLLPKPVESDFHIDGTFIEPKTDIQQIISETWKEALGREMVGIHDNFFDLGGNSLDFVRVSNKLKEKLGQDIPVAILFTYPTISSLENYLSSVELPVTSSPIPGNFVMLNGSPQSKGNIFFIHEILGDVGAYMEFCKQLGTRYNCWGVEAEKLKNYVPQNATIEDISAKYIRQIKQIQPQGPYLLATWSWGGHLGLEIALQMERMGEPLAMLAFFDCLGPDYAEGKTSQEFTLETEKTFLRNFFVATRNEADLEKINDLDQLWIRAVEVLTSDAALVEQLRLLLIENRLALPDYDDLTGEELVQYLNLSRTHSYASAHYVPGGEIHTPIHYFAANQNTKRVESWKAHCHSPVIYHEITGDHHSIFRNDEHIAEFARKFEDLLEKEIDLEEKEDFK